MGVDYFSSAANNNITIGGHDVASYEAVDGYRPTTCPAAIPVAYTDCHNFTASGTDSTYGLSTATNHTFFIDAGLGRAAVRGQDRHRPVHPQRERQPGVLPG